MRGIAILPIIVFLWGLFVILFWMYVAWRAMRAHERLAKAVEEISHKP